MNYKLLLDTAVTAGELMLENGAETYRVEDTMHRILSLSKLQTAEVFVTMTGFVATLDDPSIHSMTVVRRITERSTNLDMIDKLNALSRRLCTGELELDAAFSQVQELKARPRKPHAFLLSTPIVTSAFALTYGGTLTEALFSAGSVPVCLPPPAGTGILRNSSERGGSIRSGCLAVPPVSRLRKPGFCCNRFYHASCSGRGHHQRSL